MSHSARAHGRRDFSVVRGSADGYLGPPLVIDVALTPVQLRPADVAVVVEGNSPAEARQRRGEELVLATTNGAPAIVATAAIVCSGSEGTAPFRRGG
jgi:hypothetical protein